VLIYEEENGNKRLLMYLSIWRLLAIAAKEEEHEEGGS
jgi:hypothetical protein